MMKLKWAKWIMSLAVMMVLITLSGNMGMSAHELTPPLEADIVQTMTAKLQAEEEWVHIQNGTHSYALDCPKSALVQRFDPEGSIHIKLLNSRHVMMIRVVANPESLSAAQWTDMWLSGSLSDISNSKKLDGSALHIDERNSLNIAGTTSESVVWPGARSLRRRIIVTSDEKIYLIDFPLGQPVFDDIIATFEIGEFIDTDNFIITKADLSQTITSIPVPYYSQRGEPWKCDQYGTCTVLPSYHTCLQEHTTIEDAGCFITSQAMIFKYYTGGWMNPGELNACLKKYRLYSWQNDFSGYCAAPFDPSACMPNSVDYIGPPLAMIGGQDILDADLASGFPAIAYLPWGHYVVVIGKSGGYYQILDPFFSDDTTTLLAAGDIDSFVRYHGPSPDSNPPTKASNVRPDGWTGPYTNDTTPRFAWDAASDSESGVAGYYVAVDDWTPEGRSGNDWWAGNITAFDIPSALPDGKHIFAVTSKDNFGHTNPEDTNTPGDAPYYTFYVDVSPPSVPNIVISGPGCADTQNNVWQNACYDPDFTWSASDSSSGVKDYHYYWGTSPTGTLTTWTTDTSFDPGAIAATDSYTNYYLNLTARDNLGHESGVATFAVLYDSTSPSVTLRINNGSTTANQVNVTLNLSASDTGSGLAEVCVSNSASTCDNWQPYADAIPWALPALDRREHTVYVWVYDKAGNVAYAIDTITLDLYPPKPHSANYRICDDVLDAAGTTALTSTNYALVSAIGQPWATGAAANTSGAFGEHSGFLASITGCLPITRSVTGNYTVTQWVVASGGNLRGSTHYRLGDTAGQPAASETNAFTSTGYTLSSGFWAQITGTVPSTTGQTLPPPSPPPTQAVTPPPNSFGLSINEGALYTNDPRVTLKVWAPNVTHMRLSNDGGFADSAWRSYQITSTWVISTYGNYVIPRFVYAQFKDAQNTIYGTYMDDIIYDHVVPQGRVRIIGVAPVRLSAASVVTLSLEGSDDNSGVSQMRIANTLEELDTTPWQPYTHTLSWVMDGAMVYAQFQDQAGNVSLIYDSTDAAHALESRPMEVTIQTMPSIAPDTAHFFIASVSPSSVTLPLTYTWQATGQAPVTHANQLSASDEVSFTWDTYGPKVITATATNSLGSASGMRVITLTETPSCPAPLTGVAITGPMSGEMGTVYTFTSVLTPTDATPPITYTWSPEPSSGQSAAEATYSWDAPGEKGVTLRVENCGGVLTATHAITIVAQPPACPIPLTDVGIDAPTSGEVDTPYTFHAKPVPTDATQPITYTWSPEPDSGQDSAAAEYAWATPDTYTLTLTAENCGGSFGATHRITIADTQRYVYLPLVLRGH